MKVFREVSRRLAEPSIIDSNTRGLKRDEWLEGLAVGFRDNQFVLDQLIPERAVKFDSAKYRVFSSKGYFKAAPKRAETALPEQSALQYSEDTYMAEEYALEGWVSDDSLRNAAKDLNPMGDETEYLSQKIMLTQELLIIAEYLTAVKAAGTDFYTLLAAGTKWNGGANADILGDLSDGIKTITKNISRRPNKLFMNTDTYEVVINDSTIIDVLKRASTAPVTEAKPISALRGLAISLADAVVNTGTIDSPSNSNVLFDVDTVIAFKQTVIMAYVNVADRLTLGHNFVPKPFRVFTGRGLEGDRRQANLVAVWKKLAPKVTNVNASFTIANVLG